jgi:hypothetical protein
MPAAVREQEPPFLGSFVRSRANEAARDEHDDRDRYDGRNGTGGRRASSGQDRGQTPPHIPLPSAPDDVAEDLVSGVAHRSDVTRSRRPGYFELMARRLRHSPYC